MYTLSDKSQNQAWAIKHNKHKLAAAHLEIVDWINRQFGVRAMDFTCEARETSKGKRQQLIHVILETVEEVKQMQIDHAHNAVVAERFLKYLKSAESLNHKEDPLKGNVFSPETEPYPDIIITYRPLKALGSDVWKEMLNEEKYAMLKTFESVWTISENVIFYYTDAQVIENQANGTSDRINQELEKIRNKYSLSPDPLCRFDSKETFDRDYESKWHYYWK